MTEKEQRIVDRLHEKEFEMLCKLDEVCRKYDITYFLEAGTLIGAVRHKDFVPWDDDIDIYFKRKDFEKFLAHSDEMAPYYINVPKAEDGYFWDFTARVMNPNVKFKKDDKEAKFYNHTHCQYLFIDLFVMDNYPEGILGKIQLAELILLYTFATSRRYKGKIELPSNPVVKLAMLTLNRMGKLFSLKWIYKRYDKVSRRFRKSKKCHSYILSNCSATFLARSIYKKDYYRSRKELPVRGKNFYVPGKYDESLRSYYGDYMQLPPEKDRFPEHISYFEDVVIDGVSARDL